MKHETPRPDELFLPFQDIYLSCLIQIPASLGALEMSISVRCVRFGMIFTH
jgi:hypothetical protein